MSLFENSRKQMNDLMSQRAAHLKAAEAAKNASNMTEYQTYMNKAKDLNPKIDDLKAEVDEADRYANLHAPSFGVSRRDLEEMGNMLAAKERVKISMQDVLASIGRKDSVLVSSGSIVEPVGAGTNIRSGFATQVSALIDQVATMDLSGLSSYEEPYVKAVQEAQRGDPKTVAGTARATSDPVFRKAAINPYEVSVTTPVDRNLANLSPAAYAQKVQSMALVALRRDVTKLIVNGDGLASPKMHGILNAKNTDGENIFADSGVTSINVDTVNDLFYSYGGDEFVGGNGRLIVDKTNLNLIGKLRGTNEKKRLFDISHDPGSASTGVIQDGGMIVPYTISSAIGASKLAFFDPANYLLGLFSDYVIRIDESVYAVERLNAILGDVLVGGNLVVDKGCSIANLVSDSEG